MKSVTLKRVDNQKVLDFCNRDFVRYRHLIHALNSPCPQWDRAMLGGAEPVPVRCFVGSLDRTSLVAVVGDGLWVEGELTNITSSELIIWCRQFTVSSMQTTHEEIKDHLSQVVGTDHWGRNGQYKARRDRFRERIACEVVRLSAKDRPMWQRFVLRHGDDPMVTPGLGGSGAVTRDFEFMCSGLPVDYYATTEGEEMTGVLTVNSMTAPCDEISTVYVDLARRRKGLASSLLSVAARDIFSQGRQPTYSAAGNQEHLARMLTDLGFTFVSYSWYWWR